MKPHPHIFDASPFDPGRVWSVKCAGCKQQLVGYNNKSLVFIASTKQWHISYLVEDGARLRAQTFCPPCATQLLQGRKW